MYFYSNHQHRLIPCLQSFVVSAEAGFHQCECFGFDVSASISIGELLLAIYSSCWSCLFCLNLGTVWSQIVFNKRCSYFYCRTLSYIIGYKLGSTHSRWRVQYGWNEGDSNNYIVWGCVWYCRFFSGIDSTRDRPRVACRWGKIFRVKGSRPIELMEKQVNTALSSW